MLAMRLSILFVAMLLIAAIGTTSQQTNTIGPNTTNKPKQTVQKRQPQIQGPPKPVVKPWSTPSDAIRVAKADAAEIFKVDPTALLFTRWLWIQDATIDNYLALKEALAIISRASSSEGINPKLVGGILIRIDLRWYAPRVVDLQQWLDQFENFRFDPAFSLIITKDSIRFLQEEFRQAIEIRKITRFITTTKGVKTKGNREWKEPIKVVNIKNFVAERVNATHLPFAETIALQNLCQTEAPVIDARYFIGRALSSIKDKEQVQVDGKPVLKDTVFSLVYGGLYYELRNIRTAKEANLGVATDLDQFLFDFGIGSKDENFQQLFNRIHGGDGAMAMFRSAVTRKGRRVRYFHVPAGEPSNGQAVAFLTEDIEDADIDVGDKAVLNLVRTNSIKAFEVFITGPNGQLAYAIFDGKGKRVDEAGNKVVADRSYPIPDTTNLQSCISCIRCHGSYGNWQPIHNDVVTMFNNGFTVFGDLNNPDNIDLFDRLRGQYLVPQKKTDTLLLKLRSAQQQAVMAATGPWPTSKAGQKDLVQISHARLSEMWNENRSNAVTPEMAVRYLGVVPSDDPVEDLKVLVPKRLLPDIRIGGLQSGISINPDDFWFAYNFALTTAQMVRSQKK